MQQFFDYSPEVKQALQENKPILALESTIITHGMPYPENIETARMLEKMVREQKVVPATIAILNGRIKIGLTDQELDALVHAKNVVKASRRDLPIILTKKQSAGTTVAGTLFCAHNAGIKVFATGGIGGVHRGDELDISADLIELACTPMAVICAGVKAILDLPRTLEFLETFSIPVIGYQTDKLPAFYTSTSSYSLPARADDVITLANIMKIHWQLNMTAGVLITNPIPKEYEIPTMTIEPVIEQALLLAASEGISGKEITPFLLSEVAKATSGLSLAANIHLIKNNVRLGIELAKAIV